MLHGFIAVESGPSQPLELPSAPGKAVHRKYPGAPQEASAIELQPLTRTLKSNKSTSASRTNVASTSGPQPDTTTNANFSSGPELEEQSRPGTPNADSLNDGSARSDSAEAMQSIMNPYMNRWRLLAMCLINLSNGMSDSAPGALIPAIEEYVPFRLLSATSLPGVLTSSNPDTTASATLSSPSSSSVTLSASSPAPSSSMPSVSASGAPRR